MSLLKDRVALITGGGAINSAAANVAVAYGRSSSIAAVTPDSLTLTGGQVQVLSTGSANTLSEITNQNFAVISAGIMTGYAYAQGVFQAYLRLNQGGSLTANTVSVETSYTANAITPITHTVASFMQ